LTSIVASRSLARGVQNQSVVREIIARVRLLSTSGTFQDSSSSPTFAAAEARALGIAQTISPHTRDRADAALVFAADALATTVIEKGEQAIDGIDDLVVALAAVTGLSTDTAAFSLYLRASTSPQLMNLPPRSAAEAHLTLLVGLAPITDASLWMDELGGVRCIAAVGEAAETRRFRSIASSTVDGLREPAGDDGRAQIKGVPVVRFGTPVGAVVARARPGSQVQAAVFLLECSAMMAPILERDVFLDRCTSREQQLQLANERRLLRVGFDLHDGALQDVAAFASDLRLAREQLAQSLTGQLRTILLGRFDDLGGRLADIDQTLRELSHSLESSRVGTGSLPDTLRRELEGFDRRVGIEASLTVSGVFDALSPSQRIAIFRIAQEGLSNVREHSAASKVSIALEQLADGVRLLICDDGAGFDVSQTVLSAARRGRLGLVGMSERVRLLGGTFSLTSAPGDGTQVCVTLPSWEPVAGVRAQTVSG
jgi:signal transduction histidine kinase